MVLQWLDREYCLCSFSRLEEKALNLVYDNGQLVSLVRNIVISDRPLHNLLILAMSGCLTKNTHLLARSGCCSKNTRLR